MKDEHTYGKKMARNGCTWVIYKGTFVSIQTLVHEIYIRQVCLDSFFEIRRAQGSGAFVMLLDAWKQIF